MGRTIINNVATGQRNVDQFIDSRTVGVREEITLAFKNLLRITVFIHIIFSLLFLFQFRKWHVRRTNALVPSWEHLD